MQGGTNPYASTPAGRGVLSKTLGGSFMEASTFDWKFNSVQQIGLLLSRKFGSLRESYLAASGGKQKIQFTDFKDFLAREKALSGFNLTEQLVQQLFAELDPHRKGFLSEQDWSSAFKAFNWRTQALVELKEAVACAFVSAESAFNFFMAQGVGGQQALDRVAFKRGAAAQGRAPPRATEREGRWGAHDAGGKI